MIMFLCFDGWNLVPYYISLFLTTITDTTNTSGLVGKGICQLIGFYNITLFFSLKNK